ncbi:hypothetical protein NUW54_g13394 [Trametes sanguinea]|uniref:Uncharacterized protein n=1 Tax=Trametes sanguinea TaxID=158606 RepID=A0ACC1MMH5_9APHY|nr:hypothetical protein NUW54_g13394 [Trametes sanguinea]
MSAIVSDAQRLDDTYDHVEVTREQPVLEHTSIGDINSLALVRHDDDRSPQRHIAAEVDIARHRQVVELDDLGDLLEPLLELLDLLEVVTELDDRRRLEHTVRVDDELSVLESQK